MRRLVVLLLLLVLTGCPCDSSCDCRRTAQLALEAATATPITTASTPAGQAAHMVLRDPNASQERKAQALQLLFELERGEKLDRTITRVDELAAQLTVLLERKVEADGSDGR